LEFWSDAGASNDLTSVTVTIANSGATLLPDSGIIVGGTTYKPSDYNSGDDESGPHWGLSPNIIINHPAGANPTGATFASAFSGLWVNNSTWSLYVTDDASSDTGFLQSWAITFTYDIIVKPNDFNANKTSDLLWQNADGTPGIWLMNGTLATSIGPAGPNSPWPSNPGPTWHIKDTGDFNDDGRSDILWQNDDGTPAIWLMNGLTQQAMGAVGPSNPGPTWHVVGTGDFNFDNKADIL